MSLVNRAVGNKEGWWIRSWFYDVGGPIWALVRGFGIDWADSISKKKGPKKKDFGFYLHSV